MATQEDTNMEYVSRASSFTYCGKEIRRGIEVPLTYDAKRKYPHYPHNPTNFLHMFICEVFNENWSVMCEDCGKANGLIW